MRFTSNRIHTTIPEIPVYNLDKEVDLVVNVYELHQGDGTTVDVEGLSPEDAIEYWQRYTDKTIVGVNCKGALPEHLCF